MFLVALVEAVHYAILGVSVGGGVLAARRQSREGLVAHIVWLLVILLHWATNDNSCAVTQYVARQKQVPEQDARMFPFAQELLLAAMYALVLLSVLLLYAQRHAVSSTASSVTGAAGT